MTGQSPLSLDRRAVALSTAAVAGTMVDVALWLLRIALADPTATNLADLLPALGFLLLCTLIGSLVAVPLGLLVGLPLWHIAERAGRRSRHDALCFGLAAGAIIGGVMAAPGDSSSILDIPRLPGIWHELVRFTACCIAGTIAGRVAHRVAFGRNGDRVPKTDQEIG